MKYIITFVLLMFAAALFAQDMERMKRDVEVGENILASLLEDSYGEVEVIASNLFLNGRGNVEGSYLEGFGVLFTIAPGGFLGAAAWGDGKYVIRSGRGGAVSFGLGNEEREKEKTAGAEEQEVEVVELESPFREVVETFATDYAYLMRELPAGEKIMIRYGGRPFSIGGVAVVSGSEAGSRYSAVIEKADLNAYEKGRLSKEQLAERIRFTVAEGDRRDDRDLKLLTSIFSRLYQSDLNGNDIFRLRGTPHFERIEGLGAVIHMNVGAKFPYGTYFFNQDYNIIQLRGLRDREAARRDRERVHIFVPEAEGDRRGAVTVEGDADESTEDPAEIDEAYLDFKAELERNIVEYGSIVKELAEDEALIFRVRFFDCEDCEVMPRQLEITARQPVLNAYRTGSSDLDDAVGQLVVSTEN